MRFIFGVCRHLFTEFSCKGNKRTGICCIYVSTNEFTTVFQDHSFNRSDLDVKLDVKLLKINSVEKK